MEKKDATMITIGKPYISSSSGHDSSMVVVSLTVPTQHYEGLICECCQTETLHYFTSDDASRPEKLLALADDDDVQKYDNEASRLFQEIHAIIN